MVKEFKTGVRRKKAPNPTNWQFADQPEAKMLNKVVLPRKISLKSKFPPAYTQTCGSCTANATLACDAYYYHDPKSSWLPSTVFTYYNSRKMDGCKPSDPDDGSTVETALNAVRKYGACNEVCWPNTEPYNKKPSKEAYANGLKGHEITKYYQVKTFLQLKKALANGYPVAGAVAWCFKDYDNEFVMNHVTKKEADKCDYGHAIVFVGYDDDEQLIEFRNSWSEEWANDGYAYMTYETFKNVIWFDDTYAIVR